MAASPKKGKDRAVVIDDDTDSDTEFFRAKPRKTFARPRPPPPQPVDTTYISSDSDSQKRPKKRTKPKSTLPSWTRERQTSREPRKRADTEERTQVPAKSASAEVVSLVSDDEGDAPGPSSAPQRRARVVLTPPPDLDEEERAKIHALASGIFEAPEEEDEEEVGEVSRSSPTRDRGLPVEILVQMVADPDKRLKSAKAVAHYEKKRHFKLYQHDKLDKVVGALADRLEKAPEELMLVYNGMRLFALDRTPSQLGIMVSAQMEGYEKATWEKLQERQRAERAKLFEDDKADDASSQPDGDSDTPPSPPSDEEEKLRLVIRGAAGEVRFSCSATTAVSKICSYYCSKFELPGAQNARLNFDGEDFSGETTISDMDLESGDMVDIHYD